MNLRTTMRHGIYIGNDPRYLNKTALIMDDPESCSRGVLVQFDDRSLKEAYGWWSFYNYEFREDDYEIND